MKMPKLPKIPKMPALPSFCKQNKWLCLILAVVLMFVLYSIFFGASSNSSELFITDSETETNENDNTPTDEKNA